MPRSPTGRNGEGVDVEDKVEGAGLRPPLSATTVVNVPASCSIEDCISTILSA